MIRVPEAELMDEEEQAAAYAAADLTEWHGPLVARLLERVGPAEGCLLDVGCGTADMTVRILEACPRLTAVAVDGSAPMLARARAGLERAGLQDRVRLEHRTVPDATFEMAFDIVMATSVLHHVGEPVAFWRWLVRCARQGGRIVVLDLHRPADLDEAHRLVRDAASEARPQLQHDFFNSLCASYTAGEIRRQLDDAGLTDFQVAPLGDAHVVAWGTVC